MSKNILYKETYTLPHNVGDKCFDCDIGERIHTAVTITKIYTDDTVTSTRYQVLSRDRCLFEWETKARVSDIKVEVGDSVNMRATIKGFNNQDAHPRVTYVKNVKLYY